jgi:MFS family permease
MSELTSRRQGWVVSTLLLGAWLGSLLSGPICDRFGRKRTIMFQVVLFLLGSALQTAAQAECEYDAVVALDGC